VRANGFWRPNSETVRKEYQVARHLSVEKRHRQNIKRNRRNRTAKSKLRSVLKDFETAKEPEAKTAAMTKIASAADKAARKKVIHRNKAARIKSRAAKKAAAK
jgi:small subunit ribosomal protein S20